MLRPRLVALFASVALVVAWVGPRPARAYRPFDQTDADVAGERELELELGAFGLRATGGRYAYSPDAIINYGFAPRFELVFHYHGLVPIAGAPDPLGARIEDGELNVKHVLRRGCLQGATGPSVAAEVGVLLPSTTPDEQNVGAAAAIIVSQRWSPLAVHLNGRVGVSQQQRLQAAGGFILEGPARWPVRPVAEALVAHEAGEPLAWSGLLGAIWEVREGVSIDAAGRYVEQGDERAWEVRAGLTWTIELRR